MLGLVVCGARARAHMGVCEHFIIKTEENNTIKYCESQKSRYMCVCVC